MSGGDLVMLMAPELVLATGATAMLLLGLARQQSVRASLGLLSFLTVLVALALAWSSGPPTEPTAAFGMKLTNLTWYVRLIALSVGLVVLLIHDHLPAEGERGEVFSMILFSLAGILMTALADDLILLFLAIELVSVPTYVLVSIGRGDIRAQEAGVKYFFLGALSAAIMVYGFSFLYGAAGTTALSEISLETGSGYVAIGMLLAFAGIAFKIAAVPFHVYAADVYEGAASPVSGLLGFFPKVAGFVALVKILLLLEPTGPEAVGWSMPAVGFWFLWVVAAATMTIGNVLALMQRNVKRLLGYSSVAHSGYMLIGVLVGPVAGGGPFRNGVSAMLFYIVVYGAMNLGAFAVLSLVRARGRASEDLDDLAGLSKREPMAALALAICAFSLMGLPPTAGFVGKVYLFTSALSVGSAHGHQTALIVLAVVGVINSAIAAAYYLRLVERCYLAKPKEELTFEPHARGLQAGLLACCAAILFIGLFPQGLIQMVRQPTLDLRPARTIMTETPAEPAMEMTNDEIRMSSQILMTE